MKTLFNSLLMVWVLATGLHATTICLGNLKLPLYLHGSDCDAVIQIMDVPFVAGGASPEWWVHALRSPFIPPSDKYWKAKGDLNMTSLYGVEVGCKVTGPTSDFEVTIDASKAMVPKGYAFTIEQVVEATATCVRLMYPDRPPGEGKLVLKVVPAPQASGVENSQAIKKP